MAAEASLPLTMSVVGKLKNMNHAPDEAVGKVLQRLTCCKVARRSLHLSMTTALSTKVLSKKVAQPRCSRTRHPELG